VDPLHHAIALAVLRRGFFVCYSQPGAHTADLNCALLSDVKIAKRQAVWVNLDVGEPLWHIPHLCTSLFMACHTTLAAMSLPVAFTPGWPML
jgi:hypothetical protein